MIQLYRAAFKIVNAMLSSISYGLAMSLGLFLMMALLANDFNITAMAKEMQLYINHFLTLSESQKNQKISELAAVWISMSIFTLFAVVLIHYMKNHHHFQTLLVRLKLMDSIKTS